MIKSYTDFALRDYQDEGVQSIFDYYESGKTGNVVLALGTGLGKSWIIAGFIKRVLSMWANQRFIMLTHSKTLISQNYDKLKKIWPEAPVGIYSAGLNQKDIMHPIIFGSIQSAVNVVEAFGHRDLLICDECFSPDTEILTNKGFIRFDKLNDELVAQYNATDESISFCKPLSKIKKLATDGLIHIKSDNKFDCLVTPNHEMLINGKKILAKKIVKASYCKIKVAGLGNGFDTILQPWEKFAICYQADGSMHRENNDGSSITAFSFSKQRKIDEFFLLMKETGFSFKEVSGKCSRNPNVKPRRRFMVYLNGIPDKTIDHYFNINNINHIKAKAIVEYLNIWDGHVASKNNYLYTTTNKKMADFYQAICVLAGYRTKLVEVVDNRKETFSNVFRLFITKNNEITTQGINKIKIDYLDYVYCVSVPTGNIITRRGGKTIITGNCHCISPKEDTMYQNVINRLLVLNPNMKVIGLTATKFRLGQGLLTDDGIFSDICYDKTGVDDFNRFLAQGYISLLIPKRTNIEIDTSELRIVNGDYAKGQSDEAADKIMYKALKETVEQGYDRQSWLIFCAGIKSAEHAAEILTSFGITATTIHSKIPNKERDQRMIDFKNGKYKAISGMGIFTTGFDHPPVDLISVLRPTVSPGLHVQMLGRGSRPYDGSDINFPQVKSNCLVLDFAGNTRRLGPINDPKIPRKKGKATGEVPIKICEQCGTYNHAAARVCCNPECNFEFVFKTKLVGSAYTDVIMRSDAPIIEYFTVDRVIYHRHEKPGSPPMIKVSYFCGVRRFIEFVCLEHKGYPKSKAHQWWRQRHHTEPPEKTDDALTYVSMLRIPNRIRVWLKKPYNEILSVEW